MKLIPAPLSLTNSRMRYFSLLLLACGVGLAGGLSCASHKAPPSSPPPPSSQAAADANAQKEKDAQAAEMKAKAEHDQAMAVAAAKAKKEKDAADAKAQKKAQEEAARQAKAQKSNDSAPKSASPATGTNMAPVAAETPNAPLTKEQMLNDLNRRYISSEISPGMTKSNAPKSWPGRNAAFAPGGKAISICARGFPR